jgi:hypothetical protein
LSFSDDPGEAAANYSILKPMGYPDVKRAVDVITARAVSRSLEKASYSVRLPRLSARTDSTPVIDTFLAAFRAVRLRW